MGSNLGDRTALTRRAIAAIEPLCDSVRVSDPVESEPWGYDSPNRYLNTGITVETTLSPRQLLDRLQQIEQTLCHDPHRKPDGSYADRGLDIDIITAECHPADREPYTIISHDPALTLPHPRMQLRQFVLIPLRQLHPDWIHPLLGRLW